MTISYLLSILLISFLPDIVIALRTAPDADYVRARKRQRTNNHSTSASLSRTTIIDHHLPQPSSYTTMRLTDSDQDSNLSASPDFPAHAGPSTAGLDHANGHTNGNGFTSSSSTNGFTAPVTNGVGSMAGNGVLKHGKSIARVNVAGTKLYDDSFVDREEFVRLVIQSLRDVGYIESAATLEAESGYTMEAPEVSDFRRYVLEGSWAKAEASLLRLGVSEEEGLWDAKFLISQQKYLELLEAGRTTSALHVLRNELAPLNVDSDQLHTLSSFIMCSEPDDLRQRAGWDGASGASRRQLLANLQRYIPSSIMIPQRRFAALLQQARSYQQQRCVYHNSPSNSMVFSLYADHQCDKSAFPRITTTILEVHTDEVWNLEWSHDGFYLASTSKDKTAIIWRLAYDAESVPEWTPHHILKDHPFPVGCLAWSKDDSILLTSAENFIKLWNTKTGLCLRTLDNHTETVTALAWLPDGSGFISGGLDRQIFQWDADGSLRDKWGATAIRVTDLAVTPDFTRLVTVGMHHLPSMSSVGEASGPTRDTQAHPGDAAAGSGNGAGMTGSRSSENRMIIYDLATKQIVSSIRLEGELTSVKVSQNSQYALINNAYDEIHLWDLNAGRLARKYTGQRQGRHVIRSCFGGADGNFVVSGSEDGNVYVWHRDSGALLEVLSGHGEGSVNSVAWNPRNERMFASCSDDRTIRIWETPPPEMLVEETHFHPLSFVENGNGKGKTRQRWDSDGVDI
ncbi:WD repeat-containing protein 26 [Hypsizygus marmoreus]|uniref:WD repeat-containing protein 26 n=1 Tax=Hypsizygus marmoreus TaxID=39966 RepID=A0A369JLW6_HYPMA|nr:WD repeat-containing protein 26 [Hypsizygus marmoreus]